jgi:hypothetical protein
LPDLLNATFPFAREIASGGVIRIAPAVGSEAYHMVTLR